MYVVLLDYNYWCNLTTCTSGSEPLTLMVKSCTLWVHHPPVHGTLHEGFVHSKNAAIPYICHHNIIGRTIQLYINIIYKRLGWGYWCGVWSGLVPADWLWSPLLLGPAGVQQTSAKITAAQCLPSSPAVWFLASLLDFQLSSREGGTQQEAARGPWQDQQLRTTQTRIQVCSRPRLDKPLDVRS